MNGPEKFTLPDYLEPFRGAGSSPLASAALSPQPDPEEGQEPEGDWPDCWMTKAVNGRVTQVDPHVKGLAIRRYIPDPSPVEREEESNDA